MPKHNLQLQAILDTINVLAKCANKHYEIYGDDTFIEECLDNIQTNIGKYKEEANRQPHARTRCT